MKIISLTKIFRARKTRFPHRSIDVLRIQFAMKDD